MALGQPSFRKLRQPHTMRHPRRPVATSPGVEHPHLGRNACFFGGVPVAIDTLGSSNVCLATVLGGSRMTEERLASLYESDGFGGEKTMRAKVIRELIDEIRRLRRDLADAGMQEGASRPET